MVNEDQDNIAWIASRENPTNKPYLRVNYSLPVEIQNSENVSIVVIGEANASAEGKDVSVKVDGSTYNFVASTQNVFVDALNFDPNEPSLLAYWKAVLTGYEISKRSYVAEQTLEKTVTVAEKHLTLHLAMGEPSMAVLVVPKLGDRVDSVRVLKDNGEFKLGENALSSSLGYYYVTPTHVVVVLKKDPTEVIVTFQDVEVATRPPAFDTFYKLSLNYMIYLKLHRDELESEYEKFENFTSELKSYNVDLSMVPVSDIHEKMQTYRNITSQLPQNPVNLTAYRFRLYIVFVQSRKAFLLHRELMEELGQWNPVLEKAVLTARELAQQQANQTGEGVNQTVNQTEVIIPPLSEEVKVLIDYSHGQYYVGQGIDELIRRIRENLEWEVTVSTEPLTYDLLKEYRVVILLNPEEDLSDSEVEALQKYVESGGGLLVAGDWYAYANLESLNAVVGKYGIQFNADELMDDEQNSGRPYYPFVGIYNKDHPAMEYVSDTWVMYYNGDTLTVSGDAVWLIRAFDTGYAVDSDGNVIQEKGSRPILAAAVEVEAGRIVAYGSSRAFSDVYYGKYITSNWPFIRGVLLWLAHQE
ncbi:MAG: ThuA domain-containing protein [Thermococcus sp.]|nr:ThuA domain-containing protein [Thermococcus sp.]